MTDLRTYIDNIIKEPSKLMVFKEGNIPFEEMKKTVLGIEKSVPKYKGITVLYEYFITFLSTKDKETLKRSLPHVVVFIFGLSNGANTLNSLDKSMINEVYKPLVSWVSKKQFKKSIIKNSLEKRLLKEYENKIPPQYSKSMVRSKKNTISPPSSEKKKRPITIGKMIVLFAVSPKEFMELDKYRLPYSKLLIIFPRFLKHVKNENNQNYESYVEVLIKFMEFIELCTWRRIGVPKDPRKYLKDCFQFMSDLYRYAKTESSIKVPFKDRSKLQFLEKGTPNLMRRRIEVFRDVLKGREEFGKPLEDRKIFLRIERVVSQLYKESGEKSLNKSDFKINIGGSGKRVMAKIQDVKRGATR